MNNNDYYQAKEVTRKVNLLKDEIQKIKNQEIEYMLQLIRTQETNTNIKEKLNIQGNDNILESKKKMKESLELGFIQINQPENSDSYEQNISNESLIEEVKNEEVEIEESFDYSIIGNNSKQEELHQQIQNQVISNIQEEQPISLNQYQSSNQNYILLSNQTLVSNYEIQSVLSHYSNQSQALKKYKRYFEIDYYSVIKWYKTAIDKQRNIVIYLKEKYKVFKKKKQKKLQEAIQNNFKVNLILKSKIKESITERNEKLQSPQQENEIKRQNRLGRPISPILVPYQNNQQLIQEQIILKRIRYKNSQFYNDIRIFTCPFSNFILQIKAAKMMTQNEINKLKNLKKELKIYKRHWKPIFQQD